MCLVCIDLSIYLFVCVCVRVCVCLSIYLFVSIFVCTYVHVYLSACKHHGILKIYQVYQDKLS